MKRRNFKADQVLPHTDWARYTAWWWCKCTMRAGPLTDEIQRLQDLVDARILSRCGIVAHFDNFTQFALEAHRLHTSVKKLRMAAKAYMEKHGSDLFTYVDGEWRRNETYGIELVSIRRMSDWGRR